jgi:hypothetical protein
VTCLAEARLTQTLGGFRTYFAFHVKGKTMTTKRIRGQAYEGKRYGSLRYQLYVAAKKRIEECIQTGYYCEAITIIESVITDRLESRLSFLKGEDFSFKTLGTLILEAGKFEQDTELIGLLKELDTWRENRNRAIHELVKVEKGKILSSWDERMQVISNTANEGYRILELIYRRVADLNPLHTDRVF